jgi:hypothetical protein
MAKSTAAASTRKTGRKANRLAVAGVRKRNTFTKNLAGRSTYTCATCGRRTRDTGEQALGSDLCPQCWTLAGIENEITDGMATLDARRKQIDELIDQIETLGGKPREAFADLLATPVGKRGDASKFNPLHRDGKPLHPDPSTDVIARRGPDSNTRTPGDAMFTQFPRVDDTKRYAKFCIENDGRSTFGAVYVPLDEKELADVVAVRITFVRK